MSQQLQDDSLGFHHKDRRVFHVKEHQFFRKAADLPVFGKQGFIRAAGETMELAQRDVRKIVFQQPFGQMDVEEHGCLVPAIGAVYLAWVYYGQCALGEQMIFPCNPEGDFPVERVQQLQLFVPVQREIAAGSGGEPYQDSHGAQGADCFMVGMLHDYFVSCGILAELCFGIGLPAPVAKRRRLVHPGST